MATAGTFRGFTHPVTNLTNLGSSDVRALLSGLLQGRLDESLLFSFIHEATHHWCFASPLGEALAITHFQPILTISSELAEQPGQADDEERQDGIRYRVGDDLLSYEMVTGLLRPVIEGMAVFAEFDLVPDPRSQSMSFPLSSTLFLFLRERLAREMGEGGRDPALIVDELLFDLLERLRTTTGVRRKAGVLTEPLDDVRRGHLAGYLFVKNMWASLGHEGLRLSPDEFLCFLHSYIFSDMKMVHELLVPDDGVTDRFQRVTAAFNARMQGLMDGSAARYIVPLREWNQERLSRPTIGESLYATFGDNGLSRDMNSLPPVNDPELRQEGGHRLSKVLEDLRNNQDPMSQRVSWVLARRDRIRLVGADVAVHCPSPTRIVVRADDGEVLLAGPTVEGCTLPSGDHPGRVDAYYVPFLNVSYITVSVDDEVVWFVPSSEMSEVMSEQTRSYREGGVAELEFLEEFRAEARTYAMAETVMSVFLAQVPESIDPWYESAIVANVFPHVPSGSKVEVLERLRQHGLMAICDSANDMRGLAWLSIAGSQNRSIELAARVFDETRDFHGVSSTMTDLMDRLGSRSEAVLGERVVSSNGERLASFI